MSKKIKFSLMLITVSFFCLVFVACSKKHVCDFCGNTTKCDGKEIFGEQIYICQSCLEEIEEGSPFEDFDKEASPKQYTEVCVFENVEVNFDGISGQGTADIYNLSTDAFVSQVKFYLNEEKSSSTQYRLSNGDEITIFAFCDEDIMDKYLKKPSETSKTFVVSGLPVSVSAKDLSGELIEQTKQNAYKVILENAEKEKDYYAYDNIKYECTYFYDNEYRNDNYTPDTPKTELVVFYSLDRTDFYDNNSTKNVYCGISFSSGRGEMVKYSDGSYKVLSGGTLYDIDADLGCVACFEETLDEAISSIYPLFEDPNYYTKTKID